MWYCRILKGVLKSVFQLLLGLCLVIPPRINGEGGMATLMLLVVRQQGRALKPSLHHSARPIKHK